MVQWAIATVLPLQHKGRVPQYSRGMLQDLQAQFDVLENMGVFKKPEDVDISVEYVYSSQGSFAL